MQPTYKVIIPPKASAELRSICERIERESPQNAINVATTLIEAIDSLDLFPQRYPVRERRKDPSLVVRAMPVSSWIVYYRVDEARWIVRILRIMHGHQQQPRRFK